MQLIFDLEIWESDLPSIKRLDPWLHALMRAGPELLIQRLMEVDRSLLLWVVKNSVEVQVVEDPDSFDPPDTDHVLTPDNRLCLIFPREGIADLPVKLFLNWSFQLHDAAIINLLLASSAALESNLQEDAYRWRRARLADRGFIDYYDALAIYTPPPPELRPEAPQRLFSDEAPAELWLRAVINPNERLDRAFDALSLEESYLVQEQLGFVCNQALSADRVQLWDETAREETLQRVRSCLALALESLEGSEGTPEGDAARLLSQPLSLLFRHGYGEQLRAVAPLRGGESNLHDPEGNLRLDELPHLARWAERLLRRHPEGLSGPLDRISRCQEARQISELLRELGAVAAEAGAEHHSIGAILCTRLCQHLMGLEERGPFPLDSLDSLHEALFMHGALRPRIEELSLRWWSQVGGLNETAPRVLLRELESQLGAVPASLLEPRFIPLIIF